MITIKEAVVEIRKIAKRCDYRGNLSNSALAECAEVYLKNCDEDGTPKPRHYMRSGKEHKRTNLSEILWILTRTPSFVKWFGNSVVVDENGDPKVMYHGSWESFKEFKTSAIKLSKTAMTLWSGPGFYFSDRKEVANIYAGGKSDTVYEEFLRLENPIIIDETGNADDGVGITKRQAEKIFLDGDNTQWLDSGLSSELAKMDKDDGGAVKGKYYYKRLSRQQRVLLYIARLKTDVVILKTASHAFGAKSQDRLLKSVCKHTGHDGVVHTITPSVKEWVVYDPMAIKSATDNSGDFSPKKATVEDGCDVFPRIGESRYDGVVSALRKIAAGC